MSVQWIPLESNPEAFNDFIARMGIKGAECADVYGFDDELIDMIPKPHLALILCYPDYKEVKKLMNPVYEKLSEEGAKIPDDVRRFQMPVVPFALFHSLTQNEKHLNFGDGPFKKWFDNAKNLSVEERSDSLANASSLAEAHSTCAAIGDTDDGPNVDHHFISYVNLNGTLYEFDSSRNFPRACGPTTQETLIKDAGKHCMELSKKLGDNISFSALALVGKQE
ncbi:Ubiquitin carboxyl-terminal hydrolase [Aphelenchoides bicaudatus]|nr:Ubiquitin carboxyl-terminal hydrolase [Aphelenchoides bicaudatus]